MIVRKFMRLLLVPGMAVPLVLVACSSDDSHFLMGTALVDAAAHSEEGFAKQIEMAVASTTARNANDPSRLRIIAGMDGKRSFSFRMGTGASCTEATLGCATEEMTNEKKIERTLMADDKVFNGYDITAKLKNQGGTDVVGTLRAVVFAPTEPADATNTPESHLAFGLWMVEYKKNTMNEISVGAFGPLERAVSPPKMTAVFSGPSIGVATDDGSSKFFNAMVRLEVKQNKPVEKPNEYSLNGEVHNFDGIDMEEKIRLQSIILGEDKVLSGVTRLVGDASANREKGSGHWQAGFTSENSIVGSYGFSDDETHLIGSFGADKKM